jgi:hypothetical protein
MMRRRRPLLHTAVLGGMAYSAGKKTARNRTAAAEQETRISALEQQRHATPPPDAPPAQRQDAPPAQSGPAADTTAGPSVLDQLNQLTTLHERGALTSEEFAAAKSKLLGM